MTHNVKRHNHQIKKSWTVYWLKYVIQKNQEVQWNILTQNIGCVQLLLSTFSHPKQPIPQKHLRCICRLFGVVSWCSTLKQHWPAFSKGVKDCKMTVNISAHGFQLWHDRREEPKLVPEAERLPWHWRCSSCIVINIHDTNRPSGNDGLLPIPLPSHLWENCAN